MSRIFRLTLSYALLASIFTGLRHLWPEVWSGMDATFIFLLAFAYTWAGEKP